MRESHIHKRARISRRAIQVRVCVFVYVHTGVCVYMDLCVHVCVRMVRKHAQR